MTAYSVKPIKHTSYFKHLSSTSKMTGTIHKTPLTSEIVQKLYERGKLTTHYTRPSCITSNCMGFHFTVSWKGRKRKSGFAAKKVTSSQKHQRRRVLSAKQEPTRNRSHEQKLEDLKQAKITQTVKYLPNQVHHDVQ